MNTREEFVKSIVEDIAVAESRMNNESGFVVCNKNFVNVGEEKGINGTAVAPNCVASVADAIVYETEELAFKFGQDFYLESMGQPVVLEIVDAKSYFESQIAMGHKMIEVLSK